MITTESIMLIEKDNLEISANNIEKDQLPQLVEWLSLKDDKVRYQTLQLLQFRSASSQDVYPFWEIFHNKLKSDNSYQRSIGLMLLAENTKWDTENRMNQVIDDYLLILNDEKPITIRQCIQALEKIVPYKVNLHQIIADKLMAIQLSDIKETMRKSILMDTLNILILIKKYTDRKDVDTYISYALTGELLDKKAKKQIEAML